MNILKNLFKRKSKAYPIPCAFIDFSSESKRNNILDEQNKIIIKHFINSHGNLTTQKFKYSEALANILEKKRGIPIYDKTKEEQKFIVVSVREPAQIKFFR